jgi:TetR/AcrR family transcriptional regulator
MGIAERRRRERRQRRDDILDAAEKVFFAQSFKDATLEEIASRAELSKATLYLYFDSKEDIYLGVHMRGMGRLREMFEEAAAREKTGIEKVRAIGGAYYEFSKRYPDYLRAMIHYEKKARAGDGGQLSAQLHEYGRTVLRLVEEAIRTGIEDGTIRGDLDPSVTALLLWAQCDGVINLIHGEGRHLEEFHKTNPDDLMNDLFAFLRAALVPGGVR